MSVQTILLCDRSESLLAECKEALENGERKVLTASDGIMAMSLLGKGGVDLVVGDVLLPRLDGLELLRRLEQLNFDADVIALCTGESLEYAEQCLRHGASDYLLKPFRAVALIKAVETVLRERALRQEQGKVDDLVKMLNMQSALADHQDQRVMIKTFLQQVRDTFDADGIALVFCEDIQGQGKRDMALGQYFRLAPSSRKWFVELCERLINRGRPRLFDGESLSQALGVSFARAPVSAMGAPVAGGGHKTGAVAVVRAQGKPPYTGNDLHLLTVFSSHASLCFESQRACALLQEVNQEILYSLAMAVEAKDTYTRGHSERVGAYCAKLGRKLGISSREIEIARMAGVLHDIGKIGVPDKILNKPARLGDLESRVMRQHPVMGRTILARVRTLEPVTPIVAHHHEHVDGSGYPDRLAGSDIPFLARMLSVVDGYEAMVSNRAYHTARSPEVACEVLEDCAGRQWDNDLVRIWCELVRQGQV